MCFAWGSPVSCFGSIVACADPCSFVQGRRHAPVNCSVWMCLKVKQGENTCGSSCNSLVPPPSQRNKHVCHKCAGNKLCQQKHTMVMSIGKPKTVPDPQIGVPSGGCENVLPEAGRRWTRVSLAFWEGFRLTADHEQTSPRIPLFQETKQALPSAGEVCWHSAQRVNYS